VDLRGEEWIETTDYDALTPVFFRACETLLPIGGSYTFYPGQCRPWGRSTPMASHRFVLARTLIHDVFPFGLWSYQQINELVPLWKAFDEFGVEESEWVPYFKKDKRVQTTSKDLLASFYINRNKKRVMVVVSNLTKHAIKANLLLDRQGLGLPPGDLQVEEFVGVLDRMIETSAHVGKLKVYKTVVYHSVLTDDNTLPLNINANDVVVLRIN